ncbi:LOW QUALITY PROTEIN: uncharacterized protein O3C94_011840 [Discoglossus pictus]
MDAAARPSYATITTIGSERKKKLQQAKDSEAQTPSTSGSSCSPFLPSPSPESLREQQPGNSHVTVYYADQPQTCRRCGKTGHQGKDCTQKDCINCKVIRCARGLRRASGAKVYCRKSETVLFGEWHLTNAPLLFPIISDLIKILETWFGGNGATLKCWEERLDRVQQKFGLWSFRDLSMEGKILVLRNEILPVLQYVSQAWPPLTSVCRAISKAVSYFIWGSKMDRVKSTVMCKEPQKGGKGVPDIRTVLQIFFACNCVGRTLRDCDQGSAGVAMSHFFLLPLWRGLGWDKWDSSFPYNWTTPWFYQDVVLFVKEHQHQSNKPDLWTAKVIYKSKDIIESVVGLPSRTAETVWDNVSSKILTNRHKDTAWMAIQGGLPLRQFMHARGLCSVGAIKVAWRLMCCVKDALWWITVTTQDCRRLVLSLLRDYSILDSPEEEA